MNDKKLSTIVYGILGATLFIVAPLIFLFTTNDQGHTGLDVLKAQSAGYFVAMIAGFLVAAVFAFIAYKVYNDTQEANTALVFVIIAFIVIAVAFGKGCTDKANDGVTSPAGRPQTEVTQ